MRCINCGTEVKETAKFCPKCGTKMKPGNSKHNRKISKKTKRLLVIGLVILVILVVAFVVTGRRGVKEKLVGQWYIDDGSDMLVFNEDNTFSQTYSGEWDNEIDYFIIKDNGDLTLRYEDVEWTYQRVSSKEKALDDDSTYYISKNTLIIDGDNYTRIK